MGMDAPVEGIARRQGDVTGLQGQPVLKDSNRQLVIQQRINGRTGNHSPFEVRRALSQGVISLGRVHWPQEAKADGQFSKCRAVGMHDYLVYLEFRLVESTRACRLRRWTSHTVCFRHRLPFRHWHPAAHMVTSPTCLLDRSLSSSITSDRRAVLFEFAEAVSVRATVEIVWSRLSDLEIGGCHRTQSTSLSIFARRTNGWRLAQR